MEQLWAPWRMAYVTQGEKPLHVRNDCFICQGISETNDRNNLIVERDELSCVLLNRYPYNNGHLLIAPRQHIGQLSDLSAEVTLALQRSIQKMTAILQKRMNPDGFNVGLNLGRAAGAGLPGHLHWHVVPRWNGDTNFMAVLSDTRVIVQSLEALFDLLKDELQKTEPLT